MTVEPHRVMQTGGAGVFQQEVLLPVRKSVNHVQVVSGIVSWESRDFFLTYTMSKLELLLSSVKDCIGLLFYFNMAE